MANNTNWLNISSQSGSSGQTILTLSANKNYSTNYKTAEITAYNPVYNVSAKTYVTLEAYSPYLSLDPTLFGVPDTGGTYELTINANCGWVIAFPDLVTSYSSASGSGTTTVTFTVPSTSADTTLVGNIVVTDESGQMSRTARIEQYGAGVHMGIFPVELYFDSTGGSKTFTVTADCAYRVSMNNTPWATVSPNSGYTGQTTFTVTVNNENTGTTDLVGAVNIDAPGQDLAVILYQRKPETRLVVTYFVSSTTEPTQILYDATSFSKAEYPDGTEITLASAYTFPSTGYQSVYYTLTGTSIGVRSFDGYTNGSTLRRTVREVYIPKGVVDIEQYAFYYDLNLSAVTLPDTLTGIGYYAFYGTNIRSITFPDGLEEIGIGAFAYTYRLSSVTFPSSVTRIGSNCFTGSSASSFTFTSLTPPTLGSADALSSSSLSEIIVPCQAVNDYITAWPQYAQYISCNDTGTTLYFVTDTSNVKGIGETRTITILNTNINPNRTGLNLPSDFPQQGSYTVVGNTIYLTYPKNPSSSATRSWTIGVVAQTNDGVSLSGSYRITQNANTTYSIPYTADTSTVDWSGETRTITIDASNLVASSITIGIEGATGATYTYENGVITIVFPHNNTASQRNITVTITGETVTGNDATASITYVQEAGSPYEIPYTADTSTVDMTGETRVIYIDTSNLVQSSITVTVSGGTGVTTGYSNGVVTIVFPNISGSANDFENYTVLIEGEALNGNYAFANIEYDQYGTDITGIPLTFKILSDGAIRWQRLGVAGNTEKTIIYKINDGNWISITSSALAPIPEIQVYTGDIVRIKAENDAYANEYGYNWFALKVTTTSPDDMYAARYEVYGNILSMIYGDDFTMHTTLPSGSSYNFQHLFANSKCCGAKHLILPNNVTTHCYENMFAGCPLETAPELPATVAAGYCYSGMFQSTLVETAPALPITTFCHNPFIVGGVDAPGCYSDMFANCRNLRTAPALPATELNSYCYKGMFRNCSSLTEAPALPAISLYPLNPGTTYDYGEYCYQFMFAGCTSLTEAPELPATVMTEGCYSNMFAGCTNLSAITCLARDISANYCTSNWVENVAQSGVFTKNHNMSSWTIGNSGIPTNWVVQDKLPDILTGNCLAVTYEVTSTTQPTQILYNSSGSLLSIEMAKYNDTEIDIQTGYTFPSTGPQTILFYLTSSTIPDYAFQDCSDITTCTIGEGITVLGYSCLCGTSLTSVTIGSGVTTLNDGCLCGTSLTSITIPNSVTTLGTDCLYDTSLTSLTIPSSVTTIRGVVLTDCQDLTIDSNTYMAASASSYSGKLANHFPGVKNIHFGPNVTTIGSYSFSDRSNKIFFVDSITFTNNLTRLEPYAFSNFHRNFAQLGLTLPDSVTYIGESCFQNCGFNEVILPSGITSLPYRCFYQAYNLKSIVIPDSVTTIGESCFESLESKAGNDNGKVGNITAVTIGSGVTSIGPKAFQFCYNLAHITAKPTIAPTFESNTFNKVNVAYEWYDNNGRPHWAYGETGYLYRPAGSDYSTWIAQLGWQEEDIV